MKYFSIFFIVFSIFACNTDEDPEISTPDALPALDVEIVNDFMPLESYQNVSKVVFKNSSGEERSMTPNIQETEQEVLLNNKIPYVAKRIEITLQDELKDNFTISMQGSATYRNIDESEEFLYGAIFSQINGGFTPFIQISEELEPVFETQYLESVELLGKTFYNVYHNKIQPGSNVKFEQFHYTTGAGFVAFRDEENNLWVFDRFEP